MVWRCDVPGGIRAVDWGRTLEKQAGRQSGAGQQCALVPNLAWSNWREPDQAGWS
jgi:hypothetical protein